MNDEFGNVKKAFDADCEMKASGFETTKLPKIADEISLPKQNDFGDEDEIITLVSGSNGAAAKKEKEDEWKMPEPVFRVSSGKRADKSDKSPAKNDLPFAEAIKLEETINAAPPVQAQPNISAEFTVRQNPERQPAEAEEKTLSLLTIVLGIAAIVVFAVAFLAIVIYLFFYKTAI